MHAAIRVINKSQANIALYARSRAERVHVGVSLNDQVERVLAAFLMHVALQEVAHLLARLGRAWRYLHILGTKAAQLERNHAQVPREQCGQAQKRKVAAQLGCAVIQKVLFVRVLIRVQKSIV